MTETQQTYESPIPHDTIERDALSYRRQNGDTEYSIVADPAGESFICEVCSVWDKDNECVGWTIGRTAGPVYYGDMPQTSAVAKDYLDEQDFWETEDLVSDFIVGMRENPAGYSFADPL